MSEPVIRLGLRENLAQFSLLVVVNAFADDGPTIKRFRPRPQGRAVPILKRSSNITVVVDEREEI